MFRSIRNKTGTSPVKQTDTTGFLTGQFLFITPPKRINSTYALILKTNLPLIQLFSDSGKLREYSMWLLLKHLYANSCIYNYSLASLSRKSGIGRNGLKRYIRFFRENGWVQMKGNSMVFISHARLRGKYGVRKIIVPGKKRLVYVRSDIKISASKNLKEILSNLRFEIPCDKQKKFEHERDFRRNLISPTGLNAVAKYKAAVRALNKSGKSTPTSVLPEFYSVSISTLAIRWNVSSSTASRWIKKYENQGRVDVERQVIKRIKVPEKEAKIILKKLPGYFYHNGFLMRAEPNNYDFLRVSRNENNCYPMLIDKDNTCPRK